MLLSTIIVSRNFGLGIAFLCKIFDDAIRLFDFIAFLVIMASGFVLY